MTPPFIPQDSDIENSVNDTSSSEDNEDGSGEEEESGEEGSEEDSGEESDGSSGSGSGSDSDSESESDSDSDTDRESSDETGSGSKVSSLNQVNKGTDSSNQNVHDKNDVPMGNSVPTLEQLIKGYSDYGLIRRLWHVAIDCSQPIELIGQASKFLKDYLFQTTQIKFYVKFLETIRKKYVLIKKPPSPFLNSKDWIIDEDFVQTHKSILTQETQKHHSKIAKISISTKKSQARSEYTKLGDHCYKIGDYKLSLDIYLRSLDFCSTPADFCSLSVSLVESAIAAKDYQKAELYAKQGLKSLQSFGEKSQKLLSLFNGVLGIVYLHKASNSQNSDLMFQQACNHFLSVDPSINNNYSHILTLDSAYLYAGLCALASCNRSFIHSRFIEISKTSFAIHSDRNPQLHQLISDFFNIKYSKFIIRLDLFEARCEFDPYLAPIRTILAQSIRYKTIIQYIKPYKQVSMNKMASIFMTTVPALETQLAYLISTNQLSIRIDTENKSIFTKGKNYQKQLFSKIQRLTEEQTRISTKLLVSHLTANQLFHSDQFEVKLNQQTTQSTNNPQLHFGESPVYEPMISSKLH